MRRFIGTVVVGLVVCAIASCLVSATAVAGGYQYAGKWGTNGTGNSQFDGIGGIAVDGSGNVYVSDVGNKRIEKFSSSGTFLAKWGTLDSIDGVAVDHSGNVYAADYWNHRILKYSSSGSLLAHFDTMIAGDFDSEPHGMAVDSAGNMWITDSGDSRVKKFNSSGGYLLSLAKGSGTGQVERPVGVAVDPSNNVYVVDYLHYNIQRFTSSGTYVSGHTTICSGDANLLYPVHVAVDSSGNSYVADTFIGTLFNDGSVKKFNSSYVLQTRIGAYAAGAPLDGTFCDLRGVAVASSGKVYLADSAVGRIVEFMPAPSITSFTPTSGRTGATVALTGAYLSGATKVTFHGTSAGFSVNSATKITATVPSAATSGPIAVTTPGGTATSSASFTVLPTIVVTAPTATTSWPSGSTQTVRWTVSPAVSGGEFRLGFVSADGLHWYAGTQVLPTTGKTSYAKALKVTCPAGTYKAYVYWRPVAGTGSWTATARSAAFKVTPINITSPTATSRWKANSTQTVAWTINPAVSTGEFRLGFVSADNLHWYAGTQVLPTAGKTSYARALKVTCPAGSGYKAYVYYRPTVGTGSWTVTCKSAAFVVTL